ncbi:protein of unknown function DUF323 [Methylocella silvestris BL2]|uniref:Caspase family p20 domain-containing protein n=1 Tax=Methylocella silvestris (strain DSM 15510 / CIP 108128 / LMG 27833 / NCIMB 13906 / BL2) TaxID=395965 RepID=B8ENQ3_METSB|nr:SUMF1/EgtB/PvdO family nonheme iron enzyme [Methylocella silvestris]ACK50839.1 protein of unknown function DUF323 [Methylocella silvestris BL2]
MRFPILLLLLSLVAALASGVRPAGAAEGAGKGVALLIANAAYSGGPASATVVAGAQNLARELSRLGFAVTTRSDLDRAAMRRAIDGFIARITPGSPALFFFAGYGVEAKGSSYLIPVDAGIWTEADVRKEGVGVDGVLAAMAKAGAKPNVMILDASRRNPFERRFRSFSAGLGVIDPPPQTLLFSAAEPGKVVGDQDSESSVFIAELIKELSAPDSTADDVFNRTRLGVSRATNGQQAPVMKSTLTEPFFLSAQSAAGAGFADEAPGLEADGAAFGPPLDKRPGAVFRDCAACPSLVIVPAGAFTMGSDDFEAEQPAHSVSIAKPFAMGRFEVTNAQWDACVTGGGCGGWRPPDRGASGGGVPVSEVSFVDAGRYLDWLSHKTGRAYRLPSEAEWEYAARAGTTSRFWWGDEVGTDHANCRGCGGPGRPLAAGSYPANPFGLYDTAGNIAEWTADCWTASYAGAPRDGSAVRAPAGGGACKQRVVRGGSFDAGARYVRSASRFLYDAELRYYTNGFRVVRDLP